MTPYNKDEEKKHLRGTKKSRTIYSQLFEAFLILVFFAGVIWVLHKLGII